MRHSVIPVAYAAFAGLVLAWGGQAHAEQVVCTYTYGGESGQVLAAPVASPYEVKGIAIGSYFQFRVVFRNQPADLASIKVYVYYEREQGVMPIHQATYLFPPPENPDAPYGFTGLNFVYEPMRDGELQYWCRLDRPVPLPVKESGQ